MPKVDYDEAELIRIKEEMTTDVAVNFQSQIQNSQAGDLMDFFSDLGVSRNGYIKYVDIIAGEILSSI